MPNEFDMTHEERQTRDSLTDGITLVRILNFIVMCLTVIGGLIVAFQTETISVGSFRRDETSHPHVGQGLAIIVVSLLFSAVIHLVTCYFRWRVMIESLAERRTGLVGVTHPDRAAEPSTSSSAVRAPIATAVQSAPTS